MGSFHDAKWGEPVSTVPNEVDEIRRQMAQIRRELHEDVRGVVATAEAAADWRRYLTAYPWVSLGTAFAIGYLVVPRRPRPVAGTALQADLSKVREAVETTRQAVVEAPQEKSGEAKRKKSLVGAALGMVAPLALRAAQGYALQYLEHWIAQQQAAHTHVGPVPTSPNPPSGGPGPGPGRPAGPRPGFGHGSH